MSESEQSDMILVDRIKFRLHFYETLVRKAAETLQKACEWHDAIAPESAPAPAWRIEAQRFLDYRE